MHNVLGISRFISRWLCSSNRHDIRSTRRPHHVWYQVRRKFPCVFFTPRCWYEPVWLARRGETFLKGTGEKKHLFVILFLSFSMGWNMYFQCVICSVQISRRLFLNLWCYEYSTGVKVLPSNFCICLIRHYISFQRFESSVDAVERNIFLCFFYSIIDFMLY